MGSKVGKVYLEIAGTSKKLNRSVMTLMQHMAAMGASVQDVTDKFDQMTKSGAGGTSGVGSAMKTLLTTASQVGTALNFTQFALSKIREEVAWFRDANKELASAANEQGQAAGRMAWTISQKSDYGFTQDWGAQVRGELAKAGIDPTGGSMAISKTLSASGNLTPDQVRDALLASAPHAVNMGIDLEAYSTGVAGIMANTGMTGAESSGYMGRMIGRSRLTDLEAGALAAPAAIIAGQKLGWTPQEVSALWQWQTLEKNDPTGSSTVTAFANIITSLGDKAIFNTPMQQYRTRRDGSLDMNRTVTADAPQNIPVFISSSGDVDWEREHGLQLITQLWKNGRRDEAAEMAKRVLGESLPAGSYANAGASWVNSLREGGMGGQFRYIQRYTSQLSPEDLRTFLGSINARSLHRNILTGIYTSGDKFGEVLDVLDAENRINYADEHRAAIKAELSHDVSRFAATTKKQQATIEEAKTSVPNLSRALLSQLEDMVQDMEVAVPGSAWYKRDVRKIAQMWGDMSGGDPILNALDALSDLKDQAYDYGDHEAAKYVGRLESILKESYPEKYEFAMDEKEIKRAKRAIRSDRRNPESVAASVLGLFGGPPLSKAEEKEPSRLEALEWLEAEKANESATKDGEKESAQGENVVSLVNEAAFAPVNNTVGLTSRTTYA